MLYFTFDNSNKFGMIKFDFGNFNRAVRRLSMADDDTTWLHSLTNEEVHYIKVADGNTMYLGHDESNVQLTVVHNAVSLKSFQQVNTGGGQGGDSSSSWFSLGTL